MAESNAAPDLALLSPRQHHFFETFGFLRLPGFFADEIGEITSAFESAFEAGYAAEPSEVAVYNVELHHNQERHNLLHIADRHPRLRELGDDPRVASVAGDILGPEYESAGSDGSIFFCESFWHADTFGAPLQQRHLKFSIYLDNIDGESGAIRVIPGTNHHRTPFSRALRRDLRQPDKIDELFGVEPSEVPATVLPSTPGDLILWDYRTIHASYSGGDRRRLISISFREKVDPDSPAGRSQAAVVDQAAKALNDMK